MLPQSCLTKTCVNSSATKKACDSSAAYCWLHKTIHYGMGGGGDLLPSDSPSVTSPSTQPGWATPLFISHKPQGSEPSLVPAAPAIVHSETSARKTQTQTNTECGPGYFEKNHLSHCPRGSVVLQWQEFSASERAAQWERGVIGWRPNRSLPLINSKR